MEQFNQETKTQLNRASAIEAMLGSSGWSFAEADLMEYIAKLKDITTVDIEGENVIQQLRDQINTAAVLEDWLEGLKSQVNNATIVKEVKDKSNLMERR